jgi:hypothetical protein
MESAPGIQHYNVSKIKQYDYAFTRELLRHNHVCMQQIAGLKETNLKM